MGLNILTQLLFHEGLNFCYHWMGLKRPLLNWLFNYELQQRDQSYHEIQLHFKLKKLNCLLLKINRGLKFLEYENG